MPRVIHFEIHAGNPQQTIEFYQNLFGWEFQKWDGPAEYWVIKTGEPGTPGINGGLLRRRGAIDGTAVLAYVCTVDVPSVDVAAQKIEALGGTIVLPKMAIPTIGWLAYGKDPAGNIFGIMQTDPQAQ
jgi:uncharacterized protein